MEVNDRGRTLFSPLTLYICCRKLSISEMLASCVKLAAGTMSGSDHQLHTQECADLKTRMKPRPDYENVRVSGTKELHGKMANADLDVGLIQSDELFCACGIQYLELNGETSGQYSCRATGMSGRGNHCDAQKRGCHRRSQ